MAVYYRQIEEMGRQAEIKREEGLKGKNWRLKGLKRMKRGVISENGKQFVAEAFQRLCRGKGIVHVRITRHRPATNEKRRLMCVASG